MHLRATATFRHKRRFVKAPYRLDLETVAPAEGE
jgi:hypothetical protein